MIMSCSPNLHSLSFFCSDASSVFMVRSPAVVCLGAPHSVVHAGGVANFMAVDREVIAACANSSTAASATAAAAAFQTVIGAGTNIGNFRPTNIVVGHGIGLQTSSGSGGGVIVNDFRDSASKKKKPLVVAKQGGGRRGATIVNHF